MDTCIGSKDFNVCCDVEDGLVTSLYLKMRRSIYRHHLFKYYGKSAKDLLKSKELKEDAIEAMHMLALRCEEEHIKKQKDKLLGKQLEAYILACVGSEEYLSISCHIESGRICDMPFLGDIGEKTDKYAGKTVEKLLQSEVFKIDISTIRAKKPFLKQFFVRKLRANIDDLEIPVRLNNLLRMNGINTVKDLVSKTESDLRCLLGNRVGSRNIMFLEDTLRSMGLRLGMKV